MGYKEFNLVTLQLIIPLSTMTKAEYKNAYGIDLNDIDIEKVTLLQEDGSKNKYFVDEIKTTENGVDIYAGGKILSIGSSVSVVNNAYSVDNAKPIYCHPINVADDGLSLCRFNFLIFDNRAEPYTKSEIIAKLKSIMDVDGVILANGMVIVEGSRMVVYQIAKYTSYYGIYASNFDNGSVLDLDTLFNNALVSVNDGVNKIN